MIQELPEYNVGDFYSGPLSEINHQFHKNGKKITLYRRTQKEDNRIRRTDWAFDPDDTRDYDRRGDKDLPGPRILHELTTRIDPKKIANEEIIRQHANQVGIDTEDNDPVHWIRSHRLKDNLLKSLSDKYLAATFGDVSPMSQYEHQTLMFLDSAPQNVTINYQKNEEADKFVREILKKERITS